MAERQIWDRLAPRYTRVVRLFDRSYPVIRARLREVLDGRRRVLELAAGTGQFTPTLISAAESVVATDISPAMVERLAATMAEQDAERVETRVMSAYAIDAVDGAFDAVLCANALHVMEHPEVALRECRRVLSPGGLLIAPTFLHGVDRWRRLLSRVLGWVSPFTAHTRFDLHALEELIRRHGFQIEASETLPGVFPIGYVVGRVGEHTHGAAPDGAGDRDRPPASSRSGGQT